MDRVKDLFDEIKFISFDSNELTRLAYLILVYAQNEKKEEENGQSK